MFLLWLSQPALAQSYDFNRLTLDLQQGSVAAVLQDKAGYLWLGTGTGLVRFDGYQSETFMRELDRPDSLTHNYVNALLETRQGVLWISTWNGISRHLGGGRFANYLRDDAVTERSQRHFYPMLEFGETVWAAAAHGVWRYNSQTDQFEPIRVGTNQPFSMINRLKVVQNQLYVATDNGLYHWSEQTQQFTAVLTGYPVIDWTLLADGTLYFSTSMRQGSPVMRLHGPNQADAVAALRGGRIFYQDQQGQHWLFGDSLIRLNDLKSFALDVQNDGFFSVASMLETANELLVSTGTQVFRYNASQDTFSPMSVDMHELTGRLDSLYQTRDGTVLLSASQSGLLRWVPTARKFWHYNPPRFASDHSIGGRGVRSIFEEQRQGQQWLWTGHDAVLKKQRLGPDGAPTADTEMYALPLEKNQGMAIHQITRSHQGQLVVATSIGLLWLDESARQFRPLPLQNQLNATTKAQPEVLSLLATDDCLWLATNQGIGCADPSLQTIRHWYGAEQYPALAGNSIWQIYQATDRALWLSSEHGLLRLAPDSGQLIQFRHHPQDPNSLGHDWVHGVWQTAADTYWVATRESGLNRLTWQAGSPPNWQRFGVRHGLPTEVIYGVMGDDQGRLWCASSHGIFSFTPANGQVRHYQLADGLQSTEFNFSVSHAGRSGRFYFGGVNGVNGFRPHEVQDNSAVPALQLHSVEVNDQQPLAPDQFASLSHQQNALTLRFTGLHYAAPERMRYAYRLAGTQQDWQYVSERSARFPALPAGQYQFWLKAANPDGHWSEPQALFSFEVRPHPLLSPLAFAVYILLSILLLWAYKALRDRTERQQQLRIEQGIARESVLARNLKLQFQFTAHEMRTPLMRLRLQLEQATALSSAASARQPDQSPPLTGIPLTGIQGCLERAGQACQDLHQLLQRHLEAEALRLAHNNAGQHLAARPVVEQEVQRYLPYAREKQQQIRLQLADVAFYGQPGVLELIVANLLSNAIKYGKAHDVIDIELTAGAGHIYLQVRDSGPGIAPHEQPLVFLRHYRVSGQENVPGSGEGLFLVKTCVEDAGGSVTLNSEPDQGCQFVVCLPRGDEQQMSNATPSGLASTLVVPAPSVATKSAEPVQTAPPGAPAGVGGSILLVEDNDQLREDLAALLQPYYQCFTATDVASALALANQHLPDLVITDVMMEQQDSGFQLIKQLKAQLPTSHIPIIVLTALQSEETQLQGYQIQASLCLTKAVSGKVLLSAVAAVMRQYQLVTGRVRAGLLSETVPSNDENQQFKVKLAAVFAAVYTDPAIKAENLASHFHKSVSQLNRLCKSMMGVTLLDALMAYRVQQACQLLTSQPRSSIEAVSEQCGFGSVKTMQRQFSSQLQMTAAEYRKQALATKA